MRVSIIGFVGTERSGMPNTAAAHLLLCDKRARKEEAAKGERRTRGEERRGEEKG